MWDVCFLKSPVKTWSPSPIFPWDYIFFYYFLESVGYTLYEVLIGEDKSKSKVKEDEIAGGYTYHQRNYFEVEGESEEM